MSSLPEEQDPEQAAAPSHVAFQAAVRAEMARRMAATPAMLHSIDESGLIVSVSDAWLAKLGYRRDEVLGRPGTDFLTPESREFAVNLVLPRFFRDGRIENVRYSLLKKSGVALEVLVSAVFCDDPEGRGRISLSVVTDISALIKVKSNLLTSEAHYRNLVEGQSDLVSLSTPEGELRYVNEAYAIHYGRRPEEMVGKSLLEFVPEDEHALVVAHMARVCQTRGKVESENRVKLPDGSSRSFAWTNRAMYDSEEKLTVVHSVGRDIQDRVDAERRLQASESRYRFLAEQSTDMILLVDRAGARTFVSPASRKLLGLEPEEAMALRLEDAIHPDDAARVLPILRTNPADTLLTYRMRRKDGSYVWVETTGKTVDGVNGERQRLVIVRDVSERKLAEAQLSEANARLTILSGQDGLTGLANRRTFDETLASEHRRAQIENRVLGLVMIDVDRFKAFNDLYGHPAGDECLRSIANAIALSIRRSGEVAARYGGEEFAVVLPDTDEDGAAAVAAKVHGAVLALGLEHGRSEGGIVSVSVGVAAERPAASAEGVVRVLQEADRALYVAKNSGRNCVMRASATPAASEPPTARTVQAPLRRAV